MYNLKISGACTLHWDGKVLKSLTHTGSPEDRIAILLEQGELYSIKEYDGNSLWLADDATIIANSKENASKALKALEKAGGKCSLELSTQKTKIVQIRGNKTVEEIGDYKIEEAEISSKQRTGTGSREQKRKQMR